MKKILQKIRGWGAGPGSIAVLIVGLAVGAFAFAGMGSFMVYANSEHFCANACHEMQQLQKEHQGTIHDVNRSGVRATCNDCHVPPGFPAKYLAKARNGYHHSMGFTFQSPRPDEPGAARVFAEPIQIKQANSQILQDNCLRCHGDLVHDVVRGSTWADNAIRCVQCHRAVGHGARR